MTLSGKLGSDGVACVSIFTVRLPTTHNQECHCGQAEDSWKAPGTIFLRGRAAKLGQTAATSLTVQNNTVGFCDGTEK